MSQPILDIVRGISQKELTEAFLSRAPTLAKLPLVGGWMGNELVVPQADGGQRVYQRGHGYAVINTTGERAENIKWLILRAAEDLGTEIDARLVGAGRDVDYGSLPSPQPADFVIATRGFSMVLLGRRCGFHHLAGLPNIAMDDGLALHGPAGNEVRLRAWGNVVSYGPAATSRAAVERKMLGADSAMPVSVPLAPRACSCDMTTLLRTGCKCGGR
jgi:hypothetical protein